MNQYDELYNFRLGKVDEVAHIMAYFNREWGAASIVATNEECFRFQYQVDDTINVVLAENKETGELESVSGFVQYSKPLLDIGPAVWISSSKTALPFLGVEVIKRMVSLTNCRFWGAPGANNNSAPIFKKIFKQKVGYMKHYYMLGSLPRFEIAVVNHFPDKKNKNTGNFPATTLVPVKEAAALAGRFNFEYDTTHMPYKDAWFINKRYFEHPVYNYLLWGVETKKGTLDGLLIAREVFHKESKALKIIDFLGDMQSIGGLYNCFRQILTENKYEYIDIYCENIPDNILTSAGFTLREPEDTNIIPNYFEPFKQENVEIQFNASHPGAFVFRGDSDRDRPYIWQPKQKL